mmetsp:Transcript_16435/g.33309  ORF Transcript_16435/g.33309 Transcript_16435/m.33309 type:complete len:117 (+) Transcript_16435:910-1260(+)
MPEMRHHHHHNHGVAAVAILRVHVAPQGSRRVPAVARQPLGLIISREPAEMMQLLLLSTPRPSYPFILRATGHQHHHYNHYNHYHQQQQQRRRRGERKTMALWSTGGGGRAVVGDL